MTRKAVCRLADPRTAQAPGHRPHIPQPAAHRVPVDAQQQGHFLAALSLTTRQQVEHLQARLFVPIMFVLQPVFEIISRFSDG